MGVSSHQWSRKELLSLEPQDQFFIIGYLELGLGKQIRRGESWQLWTASLQTRPVESLRPRWTRRKDIRLFILKERWGLSCLFGLSRRKKTSKRCLPKP